MFQSMMISYVNSILEKGMELPIPQNITDLITDAEVTTHENYLLIQGNIKTERSLEYADLSKGMFLNYE